ncbi:hypothetical protein DERF_012472 [Dermatophagoides farinae]|uniref:Uncharacterized protein n=1 Tax=Dermatophagoides farinae TaxID=6954 RepID=A0A922HTJ1_DERFA|nr:hypothetical protein DERF_012472 [Dermatophagoides farinae]
MPNAHTSLFIENIPIVNASGLIQRTGTWPPCFISYISQSLSRILRLRPKSATLQFLFSSINMLRTAKSRCIIYFMNELNKQ